MESPVITYSKGNSGAHCIVDSSRRTSSGWLLVLPWSLEHIGGVNHVVKNLIRKFRDGGEFSPYLLITSQKEKSSDGSPPETIKSVSMDLWAPLDHRHPTRAMLSFIYRFSSRFRRLRRIVNEFDIRVINAHFPGLDSLMFLALKKFGQFNGNIVLSFHGDDVTEALSSKGLERQLWRILLRHVDCIVVVSNSLGSDLLTLEGGIREKLRTIYNGVCVEMFAPVKADSVILQTANERPTIISVGSFLKNKGHDVLVQAFSLVVNKIPDARLLLVGNDGPEVKTIHQLVDGLLLGEKVTIIKDIPHERIPVLLSQAQLFVLASVREGHPLAVIEAGAAGLPVVCTRTTGSLELIADKVTGRLVEIGDKHALAEAMIDLLTHPEEAQRMATKFHEYVKNNLTWKNTYRKYLQLAGDGVVHDSLMAESAK